MRAYSIDFSNGLVTKCLALHNILVNFHILFATELICCFQLKFLSIINHLINFTLVSLQQLTDANNTRFLALLTVLWQTVIKVRYDVTREISLQAGIASKVRLVTRCQLHVSQCVAVVPMLQDGSMDHILLWRKV